MSQLTRMKIEALMKGKKLPFDDAYLDAWLQHVANPRFWAVYMVWCI